MNEQIMVECLPPFGTCSLCLNDGAVRSLIVSHKTDGVLENYSAMLLNCFAVDTTAFDLGDTKLVICSSCTLQLKSAVQFKDMVNMSLKTLETQAWERSQELKKEDTLHSEATIDDDDDFHGTDDFKEELEADTKNILEHINIKKEDSQSLENLEKKEKKSRTKSCKTSRRSKPVDNDSSQIDEMLKSGLFPFKMRKLFFACSICGEKASDLDEIKTHTLGHSKKLVTIAFKKMLYSNSQRFFKYGLSLRCKLCTADCNNYEALKSHLDNCERLKSKTKCNYLPFKLEKDQLDCPLCKKRFLNFVNLNTHMNIHYPNFICENCGKAFASKARLRGHIRTHEIGVFPCKYCDLTFDKVTKREAHVSKDHKSGIKYACRKCKTTFSSFYARQKHLAELHNEELKRYKCKACPQSYITPGHLSSHVRRDHLNERNHKCDKCDCAFYTSNSLKMHMIKHDGERIHTCPHCSKSYQRKKTLREHLRIHENDKRFVCPVCARAFTQKCTLKGHLKVHEKKIETDKLFPLSSL